MDITLRRYVQLLNDIEKAEKRRKYVTLLSLSLENVVYISSIMSLDKLHRELAFRSLEYIQNYLAVLQEERELKGVIKVIKQHSIEENFEKRSLESLKMINKIYDYIEKNPGCQRSDLANQFNNQSSVEKLINSAIQLKIIREKGNKFYLIDKIPKLRTILAS